MELLQPCLLHLIVSIVAVPLCFTPQRFHDQAAVARRPPVAGVVA